MLVAPLRVISLKPAPVLLLKISVVDCVEFAQFVPVMKLVVLSVEQSLDPNGVALE